MRERWGGRDIGCVRHECHDWAEEQIRIYVIIALSWSLCDRVYLIPLSLCMSSHWYTQILQSWQTPADSGNAIASVCYFCVQLIPGQSSRFCVMRSVFNDALAKVQSWETSLSPSPWSFRPTSYSIITAFPRPQDDSYSLLPLSHHHRPDSTWLRNTPKYPFQFKFYV